MPWRSVFISSALQAAPFAVLCDSCKSVRPLATDKVVEYDLYITEQKVSPAGKPVRALMINGLLPGPTLRFREGEWARIRVHNQLKSEETSTHWHGLLLPNEQDGVPHITTPPIKPGATHTFEFKLRHAGTYWYHSHTHLQEQIGVYGSIVVTPKGAEREKVDRDQVLILSDWTNEKPEEVHRTLARGSDYYALKRGNAQSIVGAWQHGALKEYWEREWGRMSPWMCRMWAMTLLDQWPEGVADRRPTWRAGAAAFDQCGGGQLLLCNVLHRAHDDCCCGRSRRAAGGGGPSLHRDRRDL